MITIYILEKCKYCKDILKYLKNNPTQNVCLIIISKDDLSNIYKNEPRITQFPIAFTSTPKTNGLPYKNSHSITGSSTILETLKNNFGKKKMNNNIFKYGKNSLNNIKVHRNNCFGRECQVMNRPFGPADNQFILQGYQSQNTKSKNSEFPVHFGMTTPGTSSWKMERKPWSEPQILVNDKNNEQNSLGNVYSNINKPKTYSHDEINRKIYNPIELAKHGNNYINNSFGSNQNKFISSPVNSNYPFLTYAAGSNTVSRVSGKNYFPEQHPLQSPYKNAYISGNLKDYSVKHANQELLNRGFSYGKKMNKYGNQLVQTAFNSSQGHTGVAQLWKPNQFPNNGNNYGKSIKHTKTIKPVKKKIVSKYKKNTFTSPLGIEISFD